MVSGGITCYIRKQAAYETIEVKILNSPSYMLAIAHALKDWEVVSHSSKHEIDKFHDNNSKGQGISC